MCLWAKATMFIQGIDSSLKQIVLIILLALIVIYCNLSSHLYLFILMLPNLNGQNNFAPPLFELAV